MGKLNWRRIAYGIFLLCLTTAMASPAQTFTPLHSFNGTDGANPYAGLVQATGGKLYGTTSGGGVNSAGTVFKITLSGKLTKLYSFCSQANCTDGSSPVAVLVQAANGNLYGTTYGGGASDNGTVFKITPSGKLTTLYSFCSQANCTDGQNPTADLIQAANGTLYGTTRYGGANGFGTVFKMTLSGKLTTLHSFNGTDGSYPDAGLVQATNGNLYGTTSGAPRDPGARAQGDAGKSKKFGTVFKMTLSGKLTTLHSFDGTDGTEPYANLILGTYGNLYGTTLTGGANNFGTIFKITPSGKLTTLYNFCSRHKCKDGGESYGLIQATDGNLYGTTLIGGANNLGTVFRLSF
jgi:uncharacterized repeat protein (TIGR03803 family)